MQVKGLQPDPDKVVRIVTKRGQIGTGEQYLDGIVRNVRRGDGGDEGYEVVLYSPTYDKEHTYYVSGNDTVTEVTRTAGPANT
ncbi:hypothetical protein [Streptomyces chryseus]